MLDTIHPCTTHCSSQYYEPCRDFFHTCRSPDNMVGVIGNLDLISRPLENSIQVAYIVKSFYYTCMLHFDLMVHLDLGMHLKHQWLV